MIEGKSLGRTFRNADRSVDALLDISFEAVATEFLCIVGPSGCGKSTFLRLLAGLDQPSSGTLSVRSVDSNRRPKIAMVFQEPGLMPWLSVLDNVLLPLQKSSLDKDALRARGMESITRVGLSGFEHFLPGDLSGGMKQRVSLARAFAVHPEILLLDEPFSNLDYQSKCYHQRLLQELWAATLPTVIFVTHDIQEAVLLADRILIFTSRPGMIKSRISIDFSRPRDPVGMLLNPRATELITQISEMIEFHLNRDEDPE